MQTSRAGSHYSLYFLIFKESSAKDKMRHFKKKKIEKGDVLFCEKRRLKKQRLIVIQKTRDTGYNMMFRLPGYYLNTLPEAEDFAFAEKFIFSLSQQEDCR